FLSYCWICPIHRRRFAFPKAEPMENCGETPLAMNPLLLVVNAGSSSLKFPLFKKNKADQPVHDAAGQVEGIGTQPRLTVKNAVGQALVDRAHDPDEVLHHGGAIAVIRSWL